MHDGHAHPGNSVVYEPKFLGGCSGQINRPAADKGPTIVDAHHHCPTVAEILDFDPRAERQAAVGRGQSAGDYVLAAGGQTAQPIPGRNTALAPNGGAAAEYEPKTPQTGGEDIA